MSDFKITRKAHVARTFQNIRLFSGLTVLENLLVAQHNSLMVSSGFSIAGLLGLPSYRKAADKAVEKASWWLDKIKLTDRADDLAGDLPYGDQRRLEIARAMCTQPEMLCLDEPAAGLNPRESAELNKLLLDIRDETGTSILLIEHDMSVVMEISDHVIVLEYGTKISDGDPEFVRNDPRVIAAYLGVDDDEIVDLIEDAPASTDPADFVASMLSDEAIVEKVEEHPKDNLTLIKGIGAVNESKLNAHGITSFSQIALWSAEDVKQVEEYLDFDGRIHREDWIGQAKKLAAGEKTDFSQQVEAGKVKTSHPSQNTTDKKKNGEEGDV